MLGRWAVPIEDDPLGPGDAGGQGVGHGVDVGAVVLADHDQGRAR